MNSGDENFHSPSPCFQEYSKERESTAIRKLIRFIGIFAIAFVTLIQVLEVFHNYMNPPLAVSLTFANEKVPLPSITVCFDLKLMIKKKFTLKYGIDTLSLLDDQWEQFDLKNQSLTQVFRSAVAFPRDFLDLCLYDDGHCGKSMETENTLLSDRSCTTITIKKTIKPHTANFLQLRFEEELVIEDGHIFSAYIHERGSSIPKYNDRSFLTQDNTETSAYTTYNTFRIYLHTEKHIKLKTSDEDSCLTNADLDPTMAMNECIEKWLTKGEHCILPWMSIEGEECKTLNQTRRMISKVNLLVGTECKLRYRCVQWVYKLDQSQAGETDQPMILVDIPSFNQIPIREEKTAESPLQRLFGNQAVSSLIQLLADIGGSLGIVWDVSLLWLLQSMIGGTISLILKLTPKDSEEQSTREIYTNVNDAVGTIISLSCTAFFCLMAYALLTFLWSDTKVIINESGNNVPYRYPTISFCTERTNKTFESLYYYPDEKLPPDYMKYMFENVLDNVESCQINNVSCSNMGLHFLEEHFSLMACATLDTSTLGTSSRNLLELRFRQDILGMITSIFLFDSYNMPFFARKESDSIVYGSMLGDISLTFAVTQTRVLPECNIDYFQCLEDCFYQHLLGKWNPEYGDCVASERYLPGIPQCRTGREALWNSFISSAALSFTKARCSCQRPCLQTSYNKWHLSEDGVLQTKIIIDLKAAIVSEEREEYAYSVQKLLIQVGGLMGIIIGAGLLPIIQTLTVSSLSLYPNEFTRAIENLIRTGVLLGMWTFFIYQTFLEVRTFFEFRTQTMEAFKMQDTLLLPDITVCMAGSIISNSLIRIWKWSGKGSIRKCAFNDTCSGYIDIQPKDHVEFEETLRQFQIERHLQDCTVFGQSCMETTGEFHSWETLSEINGYCSTLKLKPLKQKFHIQSDVFIQMKSDFALHLKSKMEAVSDYNVEYSLDVFWKVKKEYRVHAQSIHLVPNSNNPCKKDVTYNRDECLKNCYDLKMTKEIKCVLPWMKSISGMDPCNGTDTVSIGMQKIDEVDLYFDDSCNCPISCSTQVFTPELYQTNERQQYSSVGLHFQHETHEITNTLEYQFINLWANIGGLLTLLIGKNVWDFGIFIADMYEKHIRSTN